ncbi:MAG TPA: class I SAM-dependent methyltransferase [Verrucomicrobiales bacterium]|nr:class I SAM-dependent methyltransferase [Verrucomicrobiales bacterium]
MNISLMPDYENYTRTSRNYDQTRVPIGVDTIITEMSRGEKPLSQQTVLDAGCGTGNYLLQLHDKVDFIIGLDRNQGMLKRSEEKLLQAGAGNFELRRAELPEIPFEDDTLDRIMINQVIHHLDTKPDYPVLREFCRNAYRALRSGGSIIINTCSPQQIWDCYWYVEFVQPGAERLAQKYIPIDQLRQFLHEIGFGDVRQIVDVAEIFYGDHYYDLEGPLNAAWRDGDSIWSLLTEEELNTSLESYRRAHADNRLKEILNRTEKRRRAIGQSVFVCGDV